MKTINNEANRNEFEKWLLKQLSNLTQTDKNNYKTNKIY